MGKNLMILSPCERKKHCKLDYEHNETKFKFDDESMSGNEF